MERKHTAGPWRYSRTHLCSSDYWYVITDAAGFGPIVDVGGKDKNGQIAEAKYLITDEATIEVNARLIAASPELLDAAKLVLEYLCDGDDTIPTQERARRDSLLQAAIAKAEGQTP